MKVNGWHKIRIVAEPGNAQVYVDDLQMRGVHGISVSIPLQGIPSVTLELYPTELVIEGTAEVERVTMCPACKQQIGKA